MQGAAPSPPTASSAVLLVALIRALSGRLVGVEMVFLDIVDYRPGKEVSHGQAAAQEEANFSAADIVLDELGYEEDVVSPTCKRLSRLVHVRTRTLDDERAVFSQNVIELRKRTSGGDARR